MNGICRIRYLRIYNAPWPARSFRRIASTFTLIRHGSSASGSSLGGAKSADVGKPTSAVVRKASAKRNASETYQKLSPIEHILLRPGMYIGSIAPQHNDDAWVYHSRLNIMCKAKRLSIADKIASRLCKDVPPWISMPEMSGEFSFIPGLLKLFDEILVNACDNKARDASMSFVRVNIHPGTSTKSAWISIENDGTGIPVVMHEKEKVYIPELVMGHLLSGSNFDDGADNSIGVGGRHGYGAKLTNIFSTKFSIETTDTMHGKHYKQVWTKNMTEREEPVIQNLVGSSKDCTSVTFYPDLARFNLKHSIDAGTLHLMVRRVVDAAAQLGPTCAVSLNGVKITANSWSNYCKLFQFPTTGGAVVADAWTVLSTNGWQLGLKPIASRTDTASMAKQLVEAAKLDNSDLADVENWAQDYYSPFCMSFVNNMNTQRGGTHVTAVYDTITKKLSPLVHKTHPSVSCTTAAVKSVLQVVMNAALPNPAFDSQSKESLTSAVPTDSITPLHADKVWKSANTFMSAVITELQLRAQEDEARQVRRKTAASESKIRAIPKLEDANQAGSSRFAHECTLVLTEGDSAKALAVAGLSVVGRDKFGVFPLRGKFINVRDMTAAAALENNEVSALVKILGLDFKQTYAGLAPKDRGLRYGKVLLMTDQDVDGSHIKGLIVNFFHRFWPELLRPSPENNECFIQAFITPLIKARKGQVTQSFYTMQAFKEWQSSNSDGKGWSIKYYKGLGTNTSAEGREYFKNFSHHQILLALNNEKDDASIKLAFAKELTDARKDWIAKSTTAISAEAAAPQAVATSQTTRSLSAFVDGELAEFSKSDVVRSIPSLLDGLKPSQRKVLYACFKKFRHFGHSARVRIAADDAKAAGVESSSPSFPEIKVSQLAGFVSEHTAYHHGETSLVGTIVNMAQDFVGSNNLPLLKPVGQFGTRLQGGKDAASARYIFTKLSTAADVLFPSEDDALYLQHDDDGARVEPVVFVPTIPLVLVNGAHGIGTGWSTSIPPHDPKEVIETVRRIINVPSDTHTIRLTPWWRGFSGSIAADGDSVVTKGSWKWEESPANKARRKSNEVDLKTPQGTRFIRVTELPIGKWTDDYKAFLIQLVEKGLLADLREYHTETAVDFLLELSAQGAEELERVAWDVKSFLKLSSSISMKNMHLFGPDGRIQRYTTANSILHAFIPVRNELYQARHYRMRMLLEYELYRQENRLRFLRDVVNNNLKIGNHDKNQLVQLLWLSGYASFEKDMCSVSRSPLSFGAINGILNVDALKHDKIGQRAASTTHKCLHIEASHTDSGFDYLLNTPIVRLTADHVVSLEKEVEKLRKQAEVISATKPTSLWLNDLDRLQKILK